MGKAVLGFFELCVHVIIYAAVIYVIYRAALMSYDFAYEVFGDPVVSKYNTETVEVVVKEGETADDIAKVLKESGLIKYELAFRLRVRLEGAAEKIMPGTFELSPNMTTSQMLTKLMTEGDVKPGDGTGITR